MLSGIPQVLNKHVKAGPLGLFGTAVVTKNKNKTNIMELDVAFNYWQKTL